MLEPGSLLARFINSTTDRIVVDDYDWYVIGHEAFVRETCAAFITAIEKKAQNMTIRCALVITPEAIGFTYLRTEAK